MPEVTTEYTLDMLTESSVCVCCKTFITLEEGGIPQVVGKPVRSSYANTPLGRQEVLRDLPENFAEGILAVWGDEPVLEDPSPAPEAIEEALSDV